MWGAGLGGEAGRRAHRAMAKGWAVIAARWKGSMRAMLRRPCSSSGAVGGFCWMDRTKSSAKCRPASRQRLRDKPQLILRGKSISLCNNWRG